MEIEIIRKKHNIGKAIVHPKGEIFYTQYDIKNQDILEDTFGRQFCVKKVTVTYDDKEQWQYSKLTVDKIN